MFTPKLGLLIFFVAGGLTRLFLCQVTFDVNFLCFLCCLLCFFSFRTFIIDYLSFSLIVSVIWRNHRKRLLITHLGIMRKKQISNVQSAITPLLIRVIWGYTKRGIIGMRNSYAAAVISLLNTNTSSLATWSVIIIGKKKMPEGNQRYRYRNSLNSILF